MSKSVNIVVTCTQRKKGEVLPQLMLRSLTSPFVADRANEWTGRLSSRSSPLVELSELYTSDHWFIARSIPEAGVGVGLRSSIWVSSAGYGLLPFSCWIQPYSATFAFGHPDSVSRRSSDGVGRQKDNRDWWRWMAKWKGPVPGEPRSLTDLARQHPRTPLMIVGSPGYVDAMMRDVLTARSELSNPDLLMIISSGGADSLHEIKEHLVPCDARLQRVVGGARQSLNIRVAKKIMVEVERWPLELATLQRRYEGLLKRQPNAIRYNRQTLTDDEVIAYIQKALNTNQNTARTPLLRKLRASGYACEQSRFAGLYRQVQENR